MNKQRQIHQSYTETPSYAHNLGMGIFCLFAFILYSNPAFSQESLGDAITGMAEGFTNMDRVATVIAYMLGLGFGLYAIPKFVQHVDNPRQVPLTDPMKMILAATFFLAAPAFANALIRTFKFHEISEISGTGFAEMTSGGGEGFSLDALLGNLATDIYNPMLTLFGVFSYIAGLFILLIAIYRLTTSAQQGPKGPVGIGTAMHFVVAAVLLSAPQALGALSETIFGDSAVKTYVSMSFLSDAGADIQARADAIMSAIISFLIIIGIISFLRGWFLLKAATDGNSQASVMSAITHIVAGVLAVNIGPLMMAVQTTFNVGSSGVTFN